MGKNPKKIIRDLRVLTLAIIQLIGLRRFERYLPPNRCGTCYRSEVDETSLQSTYAAIAYFPKSSHVMSNNSNQVKRFNLGQARVIYFK